MNKLTKVINKRRKNYKPTIGITSKNGNHHKSFNAEVYYIEKAKQEEIKAQKEARKFMMNFIEEEMPDLYKKMSVLTGAIGGLGSWMYY